MNTQIRHITAALLFNAIPRSEGELRGKLNAIDSRSEERLFNGESIDNLINEYAMESFIHNRNDDNQIFLRAIVWHKNKFGKYWDN